MQGTSAQMTRANKIAARANGQPMEPMAQQRPNSPPIHRVMKSGGNRRSVGHSRRYNNGLGSISRVHKGGSMNGPKMIQDVQNKQS